MSKNSRTIDLGRLAYRLAILTFCFVFVIVFIACALLAVLVSELFKALRLRLLASCVGVGLLFAWGTEGQGLESAYLIIGILDLLLIAYFGFRLRKVSGPKYIKEKIQLSYTLFYCYLFCMIYLLGYPHWMEHSAFSSWMSRYSWLNYETLDTHLRIMAGLTVVASAHPIGQIWRLQARVRRSLLRRGYMKEEEILTLATVRKSDKSIDQAETEGREAFVREIVGRLAVQNRINLIVLDNEPIYMSDRFSYKLDHTLEKAALVKTRSQARELLIPAQKLFPFDENRLSEYLDNYCSAVETLEFTDGDYYVGAGQNEIFFTCDSCGLSYEKADIAGRQGAYCSDLCVETENRLSAFEKHTGSEWAGLTAGLSQSARAYSENVVMNGERGHGFAAEKANHLFDQLSGKSAKLVGADNAKNGADRIVNGMQIQTKFCAKPSRCVAECFDNGTFKYMKDGKPMQIEVPKGMYKGAVESLEHKIRQGQVPGVSDPAKAKEIIRESPITYKQAVNVAKFGTIESITYDAIKGVQIAGTAAGITALLTYAVAVWRGEKQEQALKAACYSGLKTGGVVWISSIVSAQLGRTSLDNALRKTTDALVRKMGPKMTNAIANIGRNGAPMGSSAAANNASKMLRGNIVTAIATTAILSTVDVTRMVRGKISSAQLFKNVTTTAAGVAGGAAGWMAGAAAGAALGSAVPVIGNVVGGIIGGLIGGMAGGTAATAATKGVLDAFIEDDAKKMFQIMEKHLSRLAVDFMLSEQEVDQVISALKRLDLNKEMRNMYGSKLRRAYANYLIKPIVAQVVNERASVKPPSDEQMIDCVHTIMEEAA